MNKSLKRKTISSIVCIMISAVLFIYCAVNKLNMNEELLSYIYGFAVGLFGVGIVIFVRYFFIGSNPEKRQQIENELNDERVISNSNNAMAISFRISVLTEAIISIVCAVMEQIEVSSYIGYAICFQLITFLIVNIYANKKN